MNLKVKIGTSGSGGAPVVKSLEDLTRMHVYVGVPEKTAVRKKAGVTNAQLAFLLTMGVRASDMRRIVRAKQNRGLTYEAATAAYIHSHGSPLYQIPPRPIIEPALMADGNRQPIEEELKLVAVAMMNDKKTEATRHLKLAGMTGQNAVRGWFTDGRNNWAPNSPSTIRRKGSANPNIDKGELRKAMTYMIDSGGGPQ